MERENTTQSMNIMDINTADDDDDAIVTVKGEFPDVLFC